MHDFENTANTGVIDIDFESDFARDVYKGLSSRPKWLSSKYFYDKRGDHIFQEIMEMDSYYLTRAEFSIFQKYKRQILADISFDGQLKIFELGAGDGKKTQILLKYFSGEGILYDYNPIDISSNVLKILEEFLYKEIPNLTVNTLQGDYFEQLGSIAQYDDCRNVVMFLGSNIGNFSSKNAVQFLSKLRSNLRLGDLLMIGFDLKKAPEIILNAYGDAEGITEKFNLNLLERINHELDGEFDLSKFKHYPTYDPMSGECRSYLLSNSDHDVYIGAYDKQFHFDQWEPVFTEISKKYDIIEIEKLAGRCGFTRKSSYVDDNNYFVDVIWEAI